MFYIQLANTHEKSRLIYYCIRIDSLVIVFGPLYPLNLRTMWVMCHPKYGSSQEEGVVKFVEVTRDSNLDHIGGKRTTYQIISNKGPKKEK